MSDYDFPTFNDGRRAVRQPTLKCWNLISGGLPLDLFWLEDDIKASGYAVSHRVESTGEKLGGFAGASERAGTITTQLDDASQADDFLPAYVLSLLKGSKLGWYVVNEVGKPVKGKEVIRLTLNVGRIINPFFSALLSPDEGDTFRITKSLAAMAATETLACSPVNTRTGATLACALAALGSTTVFPGIAIAPTTGIITFTKAAMAVGTYELDVTCTDTLANKRPLVGGNRLIVTVNA